MSFHGGLIGTIVALVLFAKRQGITVLTIADLAAGVTPVGLGLGRIGNFINGELYGRPTDVDWCMVFPAGRPGLPPSVPALRSVCWRDCYSLPCSGSSPGGSRHRGQSSAHS